jgi:hypothetical protein
MVEVLIGNGDGSFQPLKSANLSGNKIIGQGLRVIATGDLNGDGYLDIVALSLTQTNSPTFDVFLGNGDGTSVVLSLTPPPDTLSQLAVRRLACSIRCLKTTEFDGSSHAGLRAFAPVQERLASCFLVG